MRHVDEVRGPRADPLRHRHGLLNGEVRRVRLVAERVADRSGVRLVVPLPMPRDDYLETFTSDASRHEFERWLARTWSSPETRCACARRA